GLADWERPIARVETLAAYFVEEVRKVQPHGPYFLGGTSYGGMVAFEIASQLVRRGDRVGFVGLIDAYAPGHPRLRPDAPFRYRAYHLLGTPITRGPEETTRHIGEALREVWRDRWHCLVHSLTRRPLPRPLRYFRIRQAAFRATRRYGPKPYAGRLTLFRAEVQPSADLYRPDPHLGWGDAALEGVEVREIPGRHGAHIRRPHVQGLAAKLREALLEATRITR
ncbi:MAG TPA: thioesterase domain-containing protein, partial [Verrucomicrobiae bacterium]|nr:thioesterase domain-containing protein [Verrucomicrobiae bacterium]